MPIVLALGTEPALPFAGGMPLPEGADESHFLGALFGEGIEVTTAETVGLPVPATAEIVIEGHISVDETALEGPMNEYPGYNATETSPKALFAVSALTWRDGAILPVVAAGPPPEEDHTVTGTMHAAELLCQYRKRLKPARTSDRSPASASRSSWPWPGPPPRSPPWPRRSPSSAQAADRDAYLKLADDLDGFLARLRGSAATASTEERRRVLRLLVKDVLIGPEKITIRHRIPARSRAAAAGPGTGRPRRRPPRQHRHGG